MKASAALITLVTAMAGCSADSSSPKVLTLATTTTLRDSGLLDILLPMFERQSGITVRPIVVGSGQAIEMARRGDTDVLLTHSPQAEQKLMAEGFGLDRQPVMHSDFILLGPPDDPAGTAGTSIAEAFSRIAAKRAAFCSRGDESGTHVKEMAIWRKAGIEPHGPWYLRMGSGMAETLRAADEKRAYVLSERSTWLAGRDRYDVAVHVQGEDVLVNPYSVILVDPKKHPHAAVEAAEEFAAFLQSDKARAAILKFGKDRFGEPVFIPD